MKTDARIDAYIDRQAEFAKPILRYLREVMHAACPDGEESIKWSSPHFLYKGEMLAGMAAFKQHATFGFWRGSLVVGKGNEQMSGMGQFGRLSSVRDLPPFNQGARIRLNPEDAHLIGKHLGAEGGTHWVIIEDPSIARGGCRIETPNCEIDATLETRWQKLTAALAQDHDWLA